MIYVQKEKKLNSLILRTPVLLAKDPTLITSFNLKYFLKDLSPNTVTRREVVLGLQHCNLRKNRIQYIDIKERNEQ
jgi:hypothetical protein